MIGSCFHFLWGNSICLFILTLAQNMGWTLFLPDCQRRVCCHHRQLLVGYRQDKAADWLQCQVTLVFQQHCDPCMLFWITFFLIPLSPISGLWQLRTVWDDLLSSEYEQTPKFWKTTDGLKGNITVFDRTWKESERFTLEQRKHGEEKYWKRKNWIK